MTEKKTSSFTGLSALIDSELNKLSRGHFKKVTDAQKAWDNATGEKVSAITRVLKQDGPVLIVGVKNSVWMSELTLLKDELKKRLNQEALASPIEELKFRLIS